MAAIVVCSRISTDNHRHCEQVVWNILHAHRTKACTCSTSSEEIISWSRCTEQLSTCVELAFRLQDNLKSCRCSPRRASARKRPTRAITIGLEETPLNRDGAHQDTKWHTPSTWQRTGCCARSAWPVGGVRYNRPFDPHWTSTEIVWHFGRCSNLGSILLATEKPASPDRWHCLGWSRNWVRSTAGIRAWPEAIHTVCKATRRRHQAPPTRYALLRRRYITVCLIREQCSRTAIYRSYSFKHLHWRYS